MATNSISSVHKGGMNFTTVVDGHSITIDLDKAAGGNDEGAGPKILMLISLAGCTGVDVVSLLKKMKANFSDFTIHVDAHLTDDHPRFYDDVTITYSIKVSKTNESKVEKAVTLSQDKYCGVSKMFRSFAKLSSKIVFLP
jgi:putative redox protein